MLFLMHYMEGLVKMVISKLYLKLLGVKYTHSGVVASYIAMDKEISKKIFFKHKITTPKYLKYKFNENNILKKKIIFTY